MKTLEKGKDKIQYLCDVLKKETLEPAQQEAGEILAQAKKESERIIKEAQKNAETLVEEARASMERERGVFESSLTLACKQSQESLRQEIEGKLFNEEMGRLLQEGASKPDLVGKLLTAIIDAVGKEGIRSDLTALVPQTVNVNDVNQVLGQSILERLSGQSVQVGKFSGGAQVKVHERKLTIDISDEALKELLGTYLRKNFRQFLFQN